MLKRPLRLRHRRNFAHVKRVGRVRQTAVLLVNIAPNTLSNNRYGIITSRRLGNAVQRNRVRRLIREALRQQPPQFKQGCYDVVIVAKPPLVGQTLPQVQAHLQAAFALFGAFLKVDNA